MRRFLDLIGRTLAVRLLLLSSICLLLSGCGGGAEPVSTAPKSPSRPSSGVDRPLPKDDSKPAASGKISGDRLGDFAPAKANLSIPQESSVFRFAEVAKESGIDFVHVSGMNDQKNFPTANGSGLAIFDYDGDGKLDVYFASASVLPVGSGKTGKNRLYKNLGGGKFQDVTDASGLGFVGFCHGAIVGDIDNDGDQDVFLTTYGPNQLFKNNGNGTFTNVSAQYGVDRPVMYGWLEGGASADASKTPVFIDAAPGKQWKSGAESSRTLRTKVAKGQKIVFRQTDPDASHGVRFANPNDVIRLGDIDKPEAYLREVGPGTSGVAREFPPLAKGSAPVVMAEFEVIRDIPASVRFVCQVYDRAWSSSGAFLDYDNDGDLDLYVSNYGEWVFPDDDLFSGDVEKKVRLYSSPRTIRTTRHFLFRNDGSTFTEVSDKVLVDSEGKKIPGRSDGHGFGIVTADLNGDGKIDIYVANDMNPNFLYLNRGDGTFLDATETSGAAYDDKGLTQSGMGVDAEDVTGDGLPELFVTNFANEYNTLYQNYGNGNFMDSTAYFGLAADSMPWVGWGTGLVDFDNDGWPDSFVANGHVDDNRHLLGQKVEYGEPPLLHRNLEGKKFRLATRDAGAYFESTHVARGAAFGDLDDDGDIDIVINHKDGPAALLRNDTKSGHHFIRLQLQGTKSNRDAIGTRIEATVGPLKITRQRKGGTSLMSSHDPRVLIGIGKAEQIDTLTVRWPSGVETVLKGVKADQTLKLVEPSGTAKAPAPPKP